MRKEYLEIGKIVGTHGIKGAVRVQPWSDDASFISGLKTVYLKDKTPLTVLSAKPNGNITIVSFSGTDTIEKAEMLRNKILLCKRDDANIPDGRYFVDEIISCKVYDADTNEILGTLTDVSKTGANDVWHIENEGKEYLVPAIESVIVSVDIDSEKVVIRPLGGIFDED